MKKSLWLIPAAILAAALFTGTAVSAEGESLISTATAQVVQPGVNNQIVLRGKTDEQGVYFREVRIDVYDDAGKQLIVSIAPSSDAGYEPRLYFADFALSGTQQIFLGISSGGSGGFGYYYIYDVQGGSVKTLFDYETFGRENRFTGRFLNNYLAEVTSVENGERYGIDLSGRKEAYKEQLYSQDGTLKQPTPVYISGANTVFPMYNSSMNRYQLAVYQRITGVAGYDGLGYVISQQTFENGAFKTYYQMVGVYGTLPAMPGHFFAAKHGCQCKRRFININ